MKLLLIARADASASVLERFLTEQGHAVATAHGAEEAMAAIAAHADVEFVLSDESLLPTGVGERLFACGASAGRQGFIAARACRFILTSAQAFAGVDRRAVADMEAIRQSRDGEELFRSLSLLLGPQRFDAAHRQLRDHVEQRPRRLVKVDDRQLNAFAAP